jgi:polygalacturonase
LSFFQFCSLQRIRLLATAAVVAAASFVPGNAAAVTVDYTSSATAATGTTAFTFQHNLGSSGSNRLVVCSVDIADPTTAVTNVTPTVTFGGVAMTAIPLSQAPGVGQNTSKIESEMFYANDTTIGPLSGSVTVSVSLPSTPTGGVAAGCTSFYGMAQAVPDAAGNAYNGSGTAAAITLTAPAGDIVIDSFSGGFTASANPTKTASANTPQNPLFELQLSTAGILGGSSYEAVPSAGSLSVSWTSTVSRSAYSAVAFAPTAVPTYTVGTSVSPVGAGTVALSPNQANYASGTSVTVTATPAPYYAFTGFTGDLSGTTNPGTLLVDGNKSLTANFAITQCSLTINVVGQGTATPSSGNYNCGSTINLTATPGSGYSFGNWSGSGYSGTNSSASFTLTANTTETVTFVQGTTCTLSTSVTGSGSITLNPSGGTYSCGTSVGVTAVPSSGDYVFSGFSGALSGTTNPQTLVLNSNSTVGATFTQVNFPINLTVNGPGTVSLNPSASSYPTGTQVTLTATPNAGALFNGFSGGLTSSNTTATVTVNGTLNITATFANAVITQDAISHAGSTGTAASSVSWQHTLGTGTNRAVIIAVGSADSTASPDASAVVTSVLFNGVYATPVPNSLIYGGTSGMVQTQLFYLLDSELPAAGTYTVQVNLAGSIAGLSAGAVSLFGVNQGGPDAVAASKATTGVDAISTSITTVTNNDWILDVVEDNNVTALTANSGQTALWTQTAPLGTAGSSVKQLATAGTTTLGWAGSASRLTESLVAFAPATSAVPPTYTLTTSVGAGAGSISTNPGLSSFPAQTGVLLTATPAVGYSFSSWSGDVTSSANPLPYVMDASHSVVANFTSAPTCTVAFNIIGTGTVTPAAGTYNCGTVLHLTATPGSGYQFTSWSGDFSSTDNPTYFTLSANSTINVEFDPIPTCSLTMTAAGTGSVSPPSGTYACGSIINIQASQTDPAWAFSGWTGDYTGTANPATITLSQNMAITGNFVQGSTCTLTANVVGSGTVTPSSGSYLCGTQISVSAVPAAHYLFNGWSGGLTGTATPTLLTLNGNQTITATFIYNTTGITGDSRTVTEPSYPPVCSVLSATQILSSPVETSPDTTRVQAALNACPAGQAVEFSANGSYNAFIIQPITLPAGVTMLVDPEVTILGSINSADYACISSESWCTPLIDVAANAAPAPGSGIMGLGVIDGRGGTTLTDKGKSWWATGSDARPRLVFLSSHSNTVPSDDFTMYKITLKNSPKFEFSGIGNNLTIWGVRIYAPPDSPNTDGIDPSSSENITITNSYISDGDDMIAMKAGNGHIDNVTISNNHMYSGHGITIGSETNAGLNNMYVHDNAIDNGFGGSSVDSLRIKSDTSRGGEVYDVLYQNTCVNHGGDTIVIDPYYSSETGSLIPNFHDITFSNFHELIRDSSHKSTMTGYNTNGIINPLTVTLDNVQFDGAVANDFKAPDNFNNVQFTLGPGPTNIASFLVADAATASNLMTVTNNVINNNAPLDCTNAFVYLTGDLTAPTNTATAGGPFTVTAVLQNVVSPLMAGTISYPQQHAPTGTINLLEGSTIVGSGTLNGRLAYINLNNLTVGPHTYTAQFTGDTNYSAYPFGNFTLTVTSSGPVASNQNVNVPYGTATPITLSAAGSGTLTYSVVTQPTHGTLSGTAPSVTYTPTGGYTGPDSFTFKANNGADSNVATVSITVLPAPPVANSQSVNVAYNTMTGVTLTATGSGTLTYAVVLQPSHGTLGGAAPNLTYTPTSGYTGPDSFTFTASNGSTSNVATVSLTVAGPTNTATKLAFSATPATPITAGGNAGTVTVLEENSGGSLVSASDAITLTVTGPAGYSKIYPATASNGTATFNFAGVAQTAAGTYTYTATSGTLTQAQTTQVVNAGSVASLTVAGFPSPSQGGVSGAVTVSAFDSYGNPAIGFVGTVTLGSSDHFAALPAAYTFLASDAGIHTFAVTLNTAGLQSITAQTGAILASQTSISVLNTIWIVNANGTEAKLGSGGSTMTSGGTPGGSSTSGAVALDNVGDLWMVGSAVNGVVEFSSAGTLLSGSGGFTSGGLNAPVSLAIDGLGQVWVVNGNNTITVLNSSGAAISPSTGYQGLGISTPTGIAIDRSGAVWISNAGDNSVTEIIGGGAPVTTPTVTGTSTSTLGTRP